DLPDDALPRRPRRSALATGLHGGPLAVGDHGQEVRLPLALAQAFDPAPRRFVDAPKLGTDGRGPHDARVQHAGYPHVVHVRPFAGDLRRNIDARDRRADDAVLPGILDGRVLVDLQAELAFSDELGVGYTL